MLTQEMLHKVNFHQLGTDALPDASSHAWPLISFSLFALPQCRALSLTSTYRQPNLTLLAIPVGCF